MKYLKKYKLFESEENKPGHKYNWDDFLDRLRYLTDIGFVIDEESKKQYFRDDENNECDITKAHWLVTEINLTRDYFNEDDVSKIVKNNKFKYFCKWDDRIIEFQQEIASISSHFDVCYHNISMDAEGWHVSFVIWTEVEQSTRDSEKEKNLLEDTERKISSSFDYIRSTILNNFSSASRNKICKDKLDRNIYNYQGSFEGRFLVMPMNFEGSQPQQFKRSFQPKLEKGLNDFQRLIKDYGKVELRKIEEKDIDRLVSEKVDKKYFSERYLGLMGYIIEFDYDKMFNDVKQGLSNL